MATDNQQHHDRLRSARQKLVMELYARRRGGDNDPGFADAIEELCLAAISLAFATHAVTGQEGQERIAGIERQVKEAFGEAQAAKAVQW